MLKIPVANFITVTITLRLTPSVDVYKDVSCLNNVPLWWKEAISARFPSNPFVPESINELTDFYFLITFQWIGQVIL